MPPLSPAEIEKFDATRRFDDKAMRSLCYAPFVSMYFDSLGYVKACCQNWTFTLGNVGVQRLDEIWNGARTRALRKALKEYNLDRGCQFCKWQLDEGNYIGNFARNYDRYEVASDDPPWPVRMEFTVSNTCNLECIMCHGELSSAIRSRRERLPPLPKAYREEFFEDLRKYLPHLVTTNFMGGEPFLAQETLRIWDMMIEDGLSIPCHVTTNGTQYNARVERILERLPISFVVSMDGRTKETVERIRVNAKFEEVLENFRRFHAYARERGTSMVLAYCLMRQNWHEFGDFLLFGDEYDCDVCVNVVSFPVKCSLFAMPRAELQGVLAAMERQEASLLPKLGRNRHVWIVERDRIRNKLEQPAESPEWFALINISAPFAEQAAEATDEGAQEALAREALSAWSGGGEVTGIVLDRDEEVVRSLAGRGFLGVPDDQCVGRTMIEMYLQLRILYGTEMTDVKMDLGPERSDRIIAFSSPIAPTTHARMIAFPRRDAEGRGIGSILLGAVRPMRPAGQGAASTDSPVERAVGIAPGSAADS